MCKICNALAGDSGFCPECEMSLTQDAYRQAEHIAPYTVQHLWSDWFDGRISGEELDAAVYAIIS